MNQPTYAVDVSDDRLNFEFESVGPNGSVTKSVVYSPFPDVPGLYNLGFGDLDEDGRINDETITNNGDRNKVLATVISTLFLFLETHPTAMVFFLGSTPLRTQLYQRIIQSNLMSLTNVLVVSGIRQGVVEPFNSRTYYDSFLIQKRY